MSAPASRRGFLRELVGLPLIGGGLTLIGQPIAVAEPCTDDTMLRYCAWLAHEHRAALVERAIRVAERSVEAGLAAGERIRPEYLSEAREIARKHPPMYWFPEAPTVERTVAATPPSTRAALVLASVGCSWRN